MSEHTPLDDRERSLLCNLAVQVVAAQTGDSMKDTADVLDELAGEGLVSIYRNATDAYLSVRDHAGEDHVIVHAERAWLHVAAHRGDSAMN